MLFIHRKEVNMPSETNRKQWTDPKVLVFGDVEGLRLANNKVPGTGDAFTFEGQPTRLSS
jgi:hypothetical protein